MSLYYVNTTQVNVSTTDVDTAWWTTSKSDYSK